MKIIDVETWPRRDHYRWYRAYARPHFSMTSELDATGLVRRAKASGRSLFSEALHALTDAASAVPAMRQRIRIVDGADVVVEHPRVDPGFTVALPGDRFGFAAAPWREDPGDFEREVRAATEAAQAADGLTPFDDERDDLVYLSCLPWVRFTHIEHSIRGPDDCTPRIAWGRLTRDGERWRVPVNALAHHALVDGAHLGRFFQRVEALFAEGPGDRTSLA